MREKLKPYVRSKETKDGDLYLESGFDASGVSHKLYKQLLSMEQSATEAWLERNGWVRPELAEDIAAFVARFEIYGPDDDGLFWLWAHDSANNFYFMLNLGEHSEGIARGLANLEEARRRVFEMTEQEAK